MIDIGGGTGAATWAAAQAFPDLTTATVLDGSADALATGQRIARHGPPAVASATWSRTMLRADTVLPQADLAIVSYVLGELADALQGSVVDAAATASPTVLVIEPGTPRGYAAVLAARARLTTAGWHVLAPCPQDGPCPIASRDDWCHFSVRLDRSALHRRLKGGRLGHEDEKFSYVVATRDPALTPGHGHPHDARGGLRAGAGAAASGHEKGARDARGVPRRRVRRAGDHHETVSDGLPCCPGRCMGEHLARPGPRQRRSAHHREQ